MVRVWSVWSARGPSLNISVTPPYLLPPGMCCGPAECVPQESRCGLKLVGQILEPCVPQWDRLKLLEGLPSRVAHSHPTLPGGQWWRDRSKASCPSAPPPSDECSQRRGRRQRENPRPLDLLFARVASLRLQPDLSQP